jgi:hypothetical protein
MPAEILVSAYGQIDRDIHLKYLPKSAAGTKKFPYLDVPGWAISAPLKFLRDIHYISVILRAALCVTAELNEMVQ